jgi:phospholipase/carboxylesterase
MSQAVYLQARPVPVTASAPHGLQPLNVGASRDGYIYVPPRYKPAQPAPLVLLLHGAGGHAHHGLDILRHLADDYGLILVAPAATAHTWDVIVDSAYGNDVKLIDQSLENTFNRYAVDTRHLTIGGFSDGASYALSLGLPNADLFTHVIAFSPGFVVPSASHGAPRIFISHGTNDNVLPITLCSRKIVPRLQRAGYDVAYQEFDGGHMIPPDIARRAVNWMLE